MREALKDILGEPRLVCFHSLFLSPVSDALQSSLRLASASGSHTLPLSQAKEGTHDGPDHLVVNNYTRGELKNLTEAHKNISFVPSSPSLVSSEGRPQVDRESEFIWFIIKPLIIILTMSFGARHACMYLITICHSINAIQLPTENPSPSQGICEMWSCLWKKTGLHNQRDRF